MVHRFVLVALVANVLYAAVWLAIDGHRAQVFERWSVVIAATLLTCAYGGFSVAYYWANKTRLNTAIALNKLALFLFFGGLTLPVLWGVALRAPYDLPRNPYALFLVPAAVRCWLYWFVSLTSIGSAFEFHRRNWGAGSPRARAEAARTV